MRFSRITGVLTPGSQCTNAKQVAKIRKSIIRPGKMGGEINHRFQNICKYQLITALMLIKRRIDWHWGAENSRYQIHTHACTLIRDAVTVSDEDLWVPLSVCECVFGYKHWDSHFLCPSFATTFVFISGHAYTTNKTCVKLYALQLWCVCTLWRSRVRASL